MQVLLDQLRQLGLVSGSLILLDNMQMVEIADFESMFGAALNEEDAYAALVAADDNGDGTTKGYKRFFDEWLALGVLEPSAA